MSKIHYSILVVIILLGLSIWYASHRAPTPGKQAIDTIIVGTNAEFPPFTFKEQEKIVGFDIDVITEVCKRLDKPMQLKDMPFDALIPEIQLGNIQVIAAGMTPTEERAKRVFFTKPYFAGDPLVIITRSDKPNIKSVNDLIGKEVVVNEGYTSDMYMSKIAGIQLIRLSTAMISEGLLALQSDRAHAFVSSRSAVKPYFEKYGTKEFAMIPIKETEEMYAFAISKHYPALYTQIQEVLTAVQKDGTLDQLKEKWNLQ